MTQIFRAFIVAFLSLAAANVAHGFNYLGHSVIAKVAYDKLTPAQRVTIHEILKQHPHYAEYLLADKPMGVTDEEWSIIRAATWADWVRSNHRAEFNKSEWHYINFPYKMGQNTSPLPAPLPQPENILERLPVAITMVKSGGAMNELGLLSSLTAEQLRAVALTWIFHLIGDAHQPLHMVAMINDPTWPASIHGDQGGNGVAVVITGAKPTKLHAYWDGVLGDDQWYQSITTVRNSFTTDPPFSGNELPTLVSQMDFKAWGAEGYKLAAKYCYLDGTLTLSPWLMSYDQGADAAPGVPVLSNAVKENAQTIYRQRLLLAGERLASQLNTMFP